MEYNNVSLSAGLLNTARRPIANKSLQVINQSNAPSTTYNDLLVTQADWSSDVNKETWITVFGFPPGISSFILKEFSQYGTILQYVAAAECNWMYMHFSTKTEALKALSKSGKIYGGNMKIGVTPCDEKVLPDKPTPKCDVSFISKLKEYMIGF